MRNLNQSLLRTAVLTAVFLTGLGAPTAFAQTTTSSTQVPSYNFSTVPVAYKAQNLANLASTFGSCSVGSAANALGAIGTAATGSALPTSVGDVASNIANGAISSGSCSGSDQTPQDNSDNNNVCSMTQNSDGSFNSTYFDNLINQADKIQDTANCRLKQYSNIQSEMQCMQSQATSLQSQISSLSTSLQTNLSAQAKDVSTIDNVIEDRNEQAQQVANRLGSAGTSGSGGSGLIGAQNQITSDLSGWASAIANEQQQVTQLTIAKAQLVVTAQQRTLALTSQCFQNTPNPAYQCTPNGPPVSAEQYVLCRVYQQTHVVAGHVLSSTSADSAGTAAQQGLQAILNNLFADTSTFQTVSTNLTASSPNATVDQIVAQQEQSQPITSITDVETLFGSSFYAVDASSGLPVHDTIMSALTKCYGQEQAAVNQEETTPGTNLYNQQQAITQGEAQDKAAVDQQIQNMSNDYTQGMAALTLTHVPLATSQCTASTFANEMTCVTDLQTNLRGLLYGNTSTSGISINLPSDGASGSTAINFTCQGISGCVTAYEQVQTNLGNEVNRLTTEKKTYITNANSATDAFLNTIKSSLSGQSQALTLKMNTLNSQMAGLGLTPIQTSTYPSTPMQTDGNGLYTMPSNLLATIGGGLSPPMIDMSGDPITQAETQLSQGLQNEQTDVTNVAQYIQQINNEEAQCKNQGTQSALKGASDFANDLVQNCTTDESVVNVCSGDANGNVYDGLINQVNALLDSSSGSDQGGSDSSSPLAPDTGALTAGVDARSNCGNSDAVQAAVNILTADPCSSLAHKAGKTTWVMNSGTQPNPVPSGWVDCNAQISAANGGGGGSNSTPGQNNPSTKYSSCALYWSGLKQDYNAYQNANSSVSDNGGNAK